MESPNANVNEVGDATPSPVSHSDPPQASPDATSQSPVRIPKKNNQSSHGMRSSSYENGDSLVLPDGVQLPPSVTHQMLDGRLRNSFLELTPAQMRDVLEEYDEAVTQKGSEIRNQAAYLFGVVKRYKTLGSRGVGDSTPHANLSNRVQNRLDALISSGFCNTTDIDAKIKDRLRLLPERDALDAIDELNGCSRPEIRNFASYFMGIINKYVKGERKDPRSRGANRVRNQRDGQKHNGKDERFSHYGRNNDNLDSPHNRRDGHGRDKQFSRDGNRDHRSRRRSRSRSYDSRSRSRSPNYRRRRRSRSRSDSRDRYHSSRHRSSRDTRNSSVPSTFGQNLQVSAPTMIPPPPPPPQRPHNMMQPLTMGQQQLLPGQPPQVMVHGGLQRPMQPAQQQFVQSLGQIPQLAQGSTDAQLQPFLQQYQQQLLQQQLQQSLTGSNMSQQSLQQLQQLQNYNLQQLNQAGKMMTGSHMAGVTNMMLGQSAPGSQPANASNIMFSMQNPDQSQLDIFGLADKAAQALSGGRLPQVNQSSASVGAVSNPNFPPLLTPANLSASTFQQNTSAHQQSSATESDLPMMVQYAMQNLRTTGHIESPLDAPLVAMLKRLPENAALSALEIFSSCDLSKMRSKSAYLAGILKKELNKLGLQ